MLTAYREGWIRPDEAKTQLAELDRKREQLENERDTLEARLSTHTATEVQTERLDGVLVRLGRRLTRLTNEERFQVLHAFIRRVMVHPDGGWNCRHSCHRVQ